MEVQHLIAQSKQAVEDKPASQAAAALIELSHLRRVKLSCHHDSLKSLREWMSLGVNVDQTGASK